jgi:hypothetical protein
MQVGTPMKIWVIRVDDTRLIPLQVKSGEWDLKKIQEEVGGYIEQTIAKYKGQNHFIYVNEEGRLRNLKTNPLASQLCSKLIVGNAIMIEAGKNIDDLCGYQEDEEDELDEQL